MHRPLLCPGVWWCVGTPAGQAPAPGGCAWTPCPTAPLCCLAVCPAVRPAPQTGSHSYKFVGGEYFNESIPYGIRYADFMFKLSEKFRTAVSVKYHAPGEELVPDQLISVQDDADLQVRARISTGRSQERLCMCGVAAQQGACQPSHTQPGSWWLPTRLGRCKAAGSMIAGPELSPTPS